MFFQLEQRAASLLNLCCLVGGKKRRDVGRGQHNTIDGWSTPIMSTFETVFLCSSYGSCVLREANDEGYRPPFSGCL